MPKETTFDQLNGIYGGFIREVDLSVNFPKLIREIQTKLLESGHLTSENQITGTFDSATKAALAAYKQSLSLQYPASIGQTTAARMTGH